MQFTHDDIAYDTQEMVAVRFEETTLFVSKDGGQVFVARMEAQHGLTIHRAERHEVEYFAERTADPFLRAIVREPEPEGAD